MSTQNFVQIGAAFFAGVTCVNVLVNFIELWAKERVKCSIIDRAGQKKKKYAVLHMEKNPA